MVASYQKHSIEEFIGKRFAYLTVIGKADSSVEHSNKFLFRCDCGNVITDIPSRVISGHRTSCGQCIYRHKWRLSKRKEKKQSTLIRDGRTKHPLYGTWRQMINRCENPRTNYYERYGGRGISVCEEWKDFWKFVEWAVRNGYSNGLSIDRIDNDGNYCPENCRWVTQGEQLLNTCRNVVVEFDGKKQSLVEWAKELNINYRTLRNRHARGWTVERMLAEPIHTKNS